MVETLMQTLLSLFFSHLNAWAVKTWFCDNKWVRSQQIHNLNTVALFCA